MRIKAFHINNFKGIANTTLHLDDGAPGNVTTLIGLNESGKTTILEALSKFISADAETAHLVGTLTSRLMCLTSSQRIAKLPLRATSQFERILNWKSRTPASLQLTFLLKKELCWIKALYTKSFQSQKCMRSRIPSTRKLLTLGRYHSE